MQTAFGLAFRDLRKYTDRKSFIALAAMMAVATMATVVIIFCIHQVLAYRRVSIGITSQQQALNAYYSQLLNAETGQRGYLLTGDPSYLLPYNRAVKTLPGEATALIAAGKNLPNDGELKPIVPLTKNKLNELNQTIQAYASQGLPAASAIVETNRGEQYMSSLRAIIDKANAQLASELKTNRATATRFGAYATWISAVTLVVMLMLGGLVYWLFLSAIKAEHELESTKEQFVSLASHQLRTPAAGIKAILSMLAAEDVGTLNGQQKKLVARAEESSQRQLRIVEELLEAARASSGRMTISPTRINVVDIINAVISEHHPTAGQTFKVDAPSKPTWIVADPMKLHMAISNLIDNAFKYGAPRGEVTLRVKKTPGRNGSGELTIEVTDDGEGIDDVDLPGIFDRYGRARATIAKGIEGTGLGLYLTRSVIELHHGSISVTSKKGGGTVFSVVLPTGHTQ